MPGFQAIIKIEEGAATSGQPGWVKASVEKPSPARVAVSAFYPYRYGISKDMYRRGRRDKRSARFGEIFIRNRHFAEWRFLPFIRIVTVYPRICNVMVIGIASPPFGWAKRLR